MSVSPGPLPTRKAMSLDVHVPSLRQRHTGVCDGVAQLGGAHRVEGRPLPGESGLVLG